jgi:hypothetical protein
MGGWAGGASGVTFTILTCCVMASNILKAGVESCCSQGRPSVTFADRVCIRKWCRDQSFVSGTA